MLKLPQNLAKKVLEDNIETIPGTPFDADSRRYICRPLEGLP